MAPRRESSPAVELSELAHPSSTPTPEKPAHVYQKQASAEFEGFDKSRDEVAQQGPRTCTVEIPHMLIGHPQLPQNHEVDEQGYTIPNPSRRKLATEELSAFQRLNLSRFKHEKWALTALQLLSAKGFKLFTLDNFPSIPPSELESLSNSDSRVKFLAMTQIAWLITQLIVRYRKGIISTQLEIAAAASAASSMLTYAILWNRPRGVTTRYRIKASRVPSSDEIVSLATFGHGYMWTLPRIKESLDEDLTLVPIPNDANHAVDVRELVAGFEDTTVARMLVEWLRHNHPAIVCVIAGSVGGTIFGGLHCLAWNFQFPTRAELLLWRVCSIATTILPLLSTYFNLQWSYCNGWVGKSSMAQRLYGPIVVIVFIIPYVLAREFLLVETSRSLFFLPPEVFIDTWPGAFLLWG
jgi:hypothetical protein